MRSLNKSGVILLVLLCVVLLVGVLASEWIESEQILDDSEAPEFKSYQELAELNNVRVDEKNNDIPVYFMVYDDFKNTNFLNVNGDEQSLDFQNGPGWKVREGIKIDNEKFIIQLIDCEQSTDMCTFRVNGVMLPPIYLDKEKTHKITLNNEYDFEIESINYAVCNQRYCDPYYDVYDEVKIKVRAK